MLLPKHFKLNVMVLSEKEEFKNFLLSQKTLLVL